MLYPAPLSHRALPERPYEDLAGLCDPDLLLEVFEAALERPHRGHLVVQDEAELLRLEPDGVEQLLGLPPRREDRVGVVHVPAVAVDAHGVLREVVDGGHVEHGGDLADLGAEPEPVRSLEAVDEVGGEREEPVVHRQERIHLYELGVVYRPEVVVVVHRHGVALGAVPRVVPAEVLLEPGDGPLGAVAWYGRVGVRYEPGDDERPQAVAHEALLDHPLGDVNGLYAPRLAALVDGEPVEPARFPDPRLEFVLRDGRPGRQSRLEDLSRSLPAHTVAARLARFVEVPEREHLVEADDPAALHEPPGASPVGVAAHVPGRPARGRSPLHLAILDASSRFAPATPLGHRGASEGRHAVAVVGVVPVRIAAAGYVAEVVGVAAVG